MTVLDMFGIFVVMCLQQDELEIGGSGEMFHAVWNIVHRDISHGEVLKGVISGSAFKEF